GGAPHGSEPGGVAGRLVGPAAPAHVAVKGDDVVLLVERVVVLHRDLLTVPDRAEAAGRQHVGDPSCVAIGVHDQVAETAARLGEIEQLRVLVLDDGDGFVDRQREQRQLVGAVLAAAAAGRERTGGQGRRKGRAHGRRGGGGGLAFGRRVRATAGGSGPPDQDDNDARRHRPACPVHGGSHSANRARFLPGAASATTRGPRGSLRSQRPHWIDAG